MVDGDNEETRMVTGKKEGDGRVAGNREVAKDTSIKKKSHKTPF